MEVMKKDMALITVQIPHEFALNVEQDRKTSFVDKLGTVGEAEHSILCNAIVLFKVYLISGGTLGLFSGLSLLSIVELAYWIYKAAIKAVSRKSK
jgi:hypothetical protein